MAHQEGQNGDSAKEVKFTALKPQLVVEATKANDAVQFYKTAFGAVEISRTSQPKRKAEQELPHVISAQLQLAGVNLLISDSSSDDSTPEKSTGSAISMVLLTEDVEAAISKAVAAGATKGEGEVTDGAEERVVKLKDPYGFVWVVSSMPKESPPTVVDVEA